MARYINSEFKGTPVRLDYNDFQNCRFENCTMIYGGAGPVSMTGCTFKNVSWAFVDAAQNTLQFMTAMYHGSGEGGKELIENIFKLIKQGNEQQSAPPSQISHENVVQA